jgi:hypothetical protein
MMLAMRYRKPNGSTVIRNLLNLLLSKGLLKPSFFKCIPLLSVSSTISCAQLFRTTGTGRLLLGMMVAL